MNLDFHIVYFACLAWDWESACKKNAKAFFKSKMLDDVNCKSAYVIFTGDVCNTDKLKNIFNHNKIVFHYADPNIKTHEYHGINKIKDLSKEHPQDKLLYFHTKGITRNGAAEDWIRYLEYFNITNYKKCLEKLQHHDVVGTEYLAKPRHHMSGNFWWATAKHISKLNVPNKKAQRHSFEFFILNTKIYTKIWSFHQSKDTAGFPGFNVKRRRYLAHEYKDLNNGKLIEQNK